MNLISLGWTPQYAEAFGRLTGDLVPARTGFRSCEADRSSAKRAAVPFKDDRGCDCAALQRAMPRANVMPTRRDFRAMTRGAQPRPGAALILGGLLLLTLP